MNHIGRENSKRRGTNVEVEEERRKRRRKKKTKENRKSRVYITSAVPFNIFSAVSLVVTFLGRHENRYTVVVYIFDSLKRKRRRRASSSRACKTPGESCCICPVGLERGPRFTCACVCVCVCVCKSEEQGRPSFKTTGSIREKEEFVFSSRKGKQQIKMRR